LSGRGYIKLRRELLDDLEAGTIILLDFAIFNLLNLKANVIKGSGSSIPPGTCITSAAAIHATCARQISERTIQRSLGRLEAIGWIKRWKVPGKRGNYPVLICRASVYDVSGNEYRVNPEASKDWRNPVLEPVGDVPLNRNRTVQSLSTDREVREEKDNKKKPTPAPETGARVEFPDWIPLGAWNAFVEMREKIRKPMTPYAVNLAIKTLEDLRAAGNEPKLVLEQSILNNYPGLFELRVPIVTRTEQERVQRNTDASVGRYHPEYKPRKQTPEEEAEIERTRIEVEQWSGLDEGTLAVCAETVKWAKEKLERLRNVPNLPLRDRRPAQLSSFLKKAREAHPEAV
jgi:hypothetical protein